LRRGARDRFGSKAAYVQGNIGLSIINLPMVTGSSQRYGGSFMPLCYLDVSLFFLKNTEAQHFMLCQIVYLHYLTTFYIYFAESLDKAFLRTYIE